ncbi:hypothetical protein niasHT_011456 [Heterodera trifolii]|uniref:Uncharacterized protein n=1 Tax=Heterodera trifolii TaxID=157864 RepID=A0ABD2L155_9BILA
MYDEVTHDSDTVVQMRDEENGEEEEEEDDRRTGREGAASRLGAGKFRDWSADRAKVIGANNASDLVERLALNSANFCRRIVRRNLRFTNWRRRQGGRCAPLKSVVDWCGCSPLAVSANELNKLSLNQ